MGGCATKAGVCTVKFDKASKRDTAQTQADTLARNNYLRSQGCIEDKPESPPTDEQKAFSLMGMFDNIGR